MLIHFNNVYPTTKFKMETEEKGTIDFLGLKILRNGDTIEFIGNLYWIKLKKTSITWFLYKNI